MKIISSILIPLFCLLVTSTDGTAQQIRPGFSVKELNAFLVQVESQLPKEGLIAEIAYLEKQVAVTIVKNVKEPGQTINFKKIKEEWKRNGTDGFPTDSTEHQNLSMSIKDISAFFIKIEALLPQHEGIVGFEMFGKQIKVKTARVFIPLAGRGHFITFERTDGEWKIITESEWIS